MSKPAIIIDIEEQVSSFGDTMTGNLVLGSSSQSLIPTSGILVHDLRNCTIAPHSFGDRLVNFYFDQSGTNGDWKGIIHMHGWTTSGYASWEIAGDAGGHIPAPEDFCIRSGVDGTWNPWRKILHSGNYSEYALPLDGSIEMKGTLYTWPNDGVSIRLQNAAKTHKTSFQIDFAGDLWIGNGVQSGNPSASIVLRGRNHKLEFATWNGTSEIHYDILHTGNKNLISPSDIGAPTLTGGGASGTWPISITGQADSVYGRYTSNGGSQPPSYIGRNTVKFNMMRTFIDNKLDPGGYMDCMLMNTYSWSDVPYATAFGMLKTTGTPRAFIACGGNSNTTWSNATELLSVANYNEHVPSKTGTGASGTWPISISGNAVSLSSTLQISKGGTGGTTVQEARTNLGLNSVKLDYTINLSSYSTSNYYFVDFGSGDLEWDCEIHSPNLGGAEPYNQNVIHFLMIHQGWSDTPKSFIMLSQGCYTSTEITIMSIVAGNQNGLKGVYLRGGMVYRIRSNIAPNLNTTTKTYGNESYASGTSSFTTITNANTVWTNDGSQKSIFSIPLYGAVWNDYAEYRQTVKNIKPGMVVIEQGDGSMKPSTDRLQPGGNIVSDTFGFAIGETDDYKTPLAVSGRALAYPAEDRYSYEPGDAVGTGPNGTVSKMIREEIMMYPERIIGTVSEIPEYERWGTGNVLVDGRIWIKVK